LLFRRAQFVGVFQFTSIVREIGVNPRRSSSFVPLVSAFDLAPIDADFLKEGHTVFGGRHPSDQCLAFEGVAIFRDVIDVVLLDSVTIWIFCILDVSKWLKVDANQPLALEIALEEGGDVIPCGRRCGFICFFVVCYGDRHIRCVVGECVSRFVFLDFLFCFLGCSFAFLTYTGRFWSIRQVGQAKQSLWFASGPPFKIFCEPCRQPFGCSGWLGGW
jgi:hypothetical protein